MKKSLVTLIMLVGISLVGYAQVGINNNDPKTTLHVGNLPSSETIAEGVLIPRVTVAELDAQDTKYTNEQNGALVFVTSDTFGTSGKKTSNITGRGFYYYDKTTSKWVAATPSSNAYGGGSFTPTPITIDLTKTTPSSVNLNSYANDYNYFEFDATTTNVIYTITFPSAVTFKNKTIYMRSNVLSNDASGVRFSGTPSEFSLPVYLKGDAVIRLYSDGTRWYLMSGNYYYTT